MTGIINQCSRCYSLRNVVDNPEECPTCRKMLGEHRTETVPLVLCAISNDKYVGHEPLLYMTVGAEA